MNLPSKTNSCVSDIHVDQVRVAMNLVPPIAHAVVSSIISLTSRKDNARILSIQQFKYIILNYLFHQATVIKGYVCSVRISNLWFHIFYSADKTILTSGIWHKVFTAVSIS